MEFKFIMENGIYVVIYVLNGAAVGDAVVVVRDGTVNGGDSGYLVSGTLACQNEAVTGLVKVDQWNASMPSIFPGYTHYSLSLSGKADPSGKAFSVVGTLVQDPKQSVTLNGEWKEALT